MKDYGTRVKVNMKLGKTDGLEKVGEIFENILSPEVLERFVEELVLNGADYAKKVCPKDKGDLESGIYYKTKPIKNGATGSVICESDHAAYVEFGTGVMGEAFAYPGDLTGYQYNVPSEHKDATGGWWYKKDGKFHYTHGAMPNPFMYQTAQYMDSIAPKIAKEILAKGKINFVGAEAIGDVEE